MDIPHEITITYLEMLAHPAKSPSHTLSGTVALIRAEKPPVHFYRYLYDTIGKDYYWVDRWRMPDEQLTAIIHNDDVKIYVLHHNGVPAGFAELDFRLFPQAELSMLGLMPEQIGEGLGVYLLHEAINLAWSQEINRLIVQTCTLDHPHALPLYQRCGFTPYEQENGILKQPADWPSPTANRL
ncbi:MAG: GNAT family N-acetyltransferase [Parvularculales bacterium]